MAETIMAIFILLLSIAGMIFRGFVAMQYWNLVFVPIFNLPTIGLAMTIILLEGIIFFQRIPPYIDSTKKKSTEEKNEENFLSVLYQITYTAMFGLFLLVFVWMGVVG